MLQLRDRCATDRATATLADEQIGRTRYRTPEGYLVCESVRIARTGPMLYRADEMPSIEQGPYGSMITILRDADVLFAPETIQSFAGKPVTNDHPDENVTPETFKDIVVGTTLNPRRGEGVESQFLLADLLIMDAQAIADVEAGKVQISPGYDCEVEQMRPGLGRQTFVLGNHTALVDQGRGGPQCAIQDGVSHMATRKKIMTGLRLAFRAKDEAAFEEQLANAGDLMDEDDGADGTEHRVVIEVKQPDAPAAADPVADDVDPNEERFGKLEAAVAAIAEAVSKLSAAPAADPAADPVADADPDDGDDAAEDEEVEKQVAMDAASKAEILVPGLRVPTFDSARVKRAAVTSVRRDALTKAYANSDRRQAIDSVLAGKSSNFSKMRARDVATVFDAAAAVVAAINNASRPPIGMPQGPMTASRYAQMIKDRRAKQA